MIQCQLKLRPSKAVERKLDGWLWNLTGVWNWGLKQIQNDSSLKYADLTAATAGHASRIGLPAVVLQATLADASKSWSRCFNGLAKRPRLKGARRRLNSIPFKDPIRLAAGNRVALPPIGSGP